MTKFPSPKTGRKRAAPAAKKSKDSIPSSDFRALAPLNFKVAKEFRREFKTFASQHDMKMVELLQEGFRLVKKQHDD